jgi:hypothetical protein
MGAGGSLGSPQLLKVDERDISVISVRLGTENRRYIC